MLLKNQLRPYQLYIPWKMKQVILNIYIYNFVNKSSSLSNAQKYEVLTNTWKPESTYSFPPDGSSGRHFQHGWLTRFPWLAYSAAVNGGFCITCVLFGGESTHNASKLQRLMTIPFIPCTSSLSKLTKHAQKLKQSKANRYAN